MSFDDGNPTMDELPGLIDKGLAMAEKRLQGGGSGLHSSIKAQLTYCKQVVDAGTKPDPAKIEKLLLGVYAAREFETSDPEYANVLFAVEYLMKRI